MPDREHPESSIIVNDRRHFTLGGELRPDAPPDVVRPPDPPLPPPAAAPAAITAPGPPGAAPPPASPREPGGLTFEAFIESLYSTALMQLGAMPDEAGRRMRPDLQGAKETIDLLGLLQEKTRGNLSPRELQMLEQALYELRSGYVALTQPPVPVPGPIPAPPRRGR
ncbi:MAG: DUF1844 domain-containing protein [Terriglobales bacterium]